MADPRLHRVAFLVAMALVPCGCGGPSGPGDGAGGGDVPAQEMPEAPDSSLDPGLADADAPSADLDAPPDAEAGTDPGADLPPAGDVPPGLDLPADADDVADLDRPADADALADLDLPPDVDAPMELDAPGDPAPDPAADEGTAPDDPGTGPACGPDDGCPDGLLCDPAGEHCVECLAAGDCPKDKACAGGRCIDPICVPLSRSCEGTRLVACSLDGGTWSLVQDCDDGDPCTVGDGCTGNRCNDTTAPDCADDDVCTVDQCQAGEGCVHLQADGLGCSDGNPCTLNDHCFAGKCVPAGWPSCDDGNPCTADACLQQVGCYHEPAALPCDDGSLCTTDDACVEGRCVGTTDPCDDGDPCTIDGCDAATGTCRHDGLPGCACTGDLDCEDGEPCSDDRCVSERCVHLPAGLAGCCEAGDACDDGDPCTRDACHAPPFGRCTHAPILGAGCCSPSLFLADLAGPLDGWENTEAYEGVGWHAVPTSPGSPAGGPALYYGDPARKTYDTPGKANQGTIRTPPVSLPAGARNRLSFRVWLDVEPIAGHDRLEVRAADATGAWTLWERPLGFPMQAWQDVEVDLSPLGGRAVRLVLAFDTVDAQGNGGGGVYVTGLRIASTCAPGPCQVASDCTALGLHGDCAAGLCTFDRIFAPREAILGADPAPRFVLPDGIALAPDGRLFVTDKAGGRILAFGPDGTFLRAFGSPGSGEDGLANPRGLAVGNDRVFVADTQNHRVQVFSPSGVPLYRFGSKGDRPGEFFEPKGVAVSPDGSVVWVADTSNHRVQALSVYGFPLFAVGGYGKAPGQFRSPSCVATAPDGRLFVCDTQNARVQAFSAAGAFQAEVKPADGIALSSPYGAVPLPDGGLWVADSYNHRLVRFDGTFRVQDRVGAYGSGLGEFSYPLGLAWDAARDRLWVVDSMNARAVAWDWAPLP